MRSLIVQGTAVKAAISKGSLSDVRGIYAAGIRNHVKDGAARLGSGLMTLTPTLGTALSRAHKLGSALSGSQLIVDHKAIQPAELPDWLNWRQSNSAWSSVDWVHGSSEKLKRLCQVSKLGCPASAHVEAALLDYMQLEPHPPEKWRALTLEMAGL